MIYTILRDMAREKEARENIALVPSVETEETETEETEEDESGTDEGR